MQRTIEPSEIRGAIAAPPSKSMMQRAVAAAMLADGDSCIFNPSWCDDSRAAMGIATALGAEIQTEENIVRIKGSKGIRENKLNCGESGLAVRMFSPIASLYPREITIDGTGSLKKRPMFIIGDALHQLGVRCLSSDGFLPLKINGPLKPGRCVIDGSLSSQVLTGLLMALPLTSGDSIITVNNLKSKPYVDMTVRLLKDFGIDIVNEHYRKFIIRGNQKFIARNYEVEGDWSGGAFLLVAGAVKGSLRVQGLRRDSLQSDRAIIEALKKAGANIVIEENAVEVSAADLKAFEFDATESPDLFPPLAVLASYARGVSEIKGASRLIHKESNRALALIEEFGKMNISIEMKGDALLITGGKIKGACVDSHNDHRIAMAAAVAALGAAGPVTVKDSDCVAKSYPEFFNDLAKAGAIIKE